MEGEDGRIRICKICREFTISRLICQNCGVRLKSKKNSNNLFRINPENDNIITIEKKRKIQEKLRLENEIRKREEKEKKEKEKREKERKLILKKVNEKYNSIKDDLPVPFSIDKNQLDKLINSNNEKCLICLEDFIENNHVLYLPCSHLFHSVCILRWLLDNNKCPICQTDYKNEEINEEEEEQNMSMTMSQNRFNNFVNLYEMNINIPTMQIDNEFINMVHSIRRGYRRNGGYFARGRGGYSGRGRGGYNGRGRRGGNFRGRGGNFRGRVNYFGRDDLNFNGFP